MGKLTGEITGGLMDILMEAPMVMFIAAFNDWLGTKFAARLVEEVVDALFTGLLDGFMVTCTAEANFKCRFSQRHDVQRNPGDDRV